MASPPNACESAGTLGRLVVAESGPGEARSEPVGGECAPSLCCGASERKQAKEVRHLQRHEGQVGGSTERTHEEGRAAAAAEAERAAPRLDELDRAGLDQRVKVLLELVLVRQRVLDRVLLCRRAETNGGQRAEGRAGCVASTRAARSGRARTGPLDELLFEPARDGVDVEPAERGRGGAGGGWSERSEPARGSRRRRRCGRGRAAVRGRRRRERHGPKSVETGVVAKEHAGDAALLGEGGASGARGAG